MNAWIRWVLVFFIATVVFAIGIAVGEAIHDNPKPGITLTTERTLNP